MKTAILVSLAIGAVAGVAMGALVAIFLMTGSASLQRLEALE